MTKQKYVTLDWMGRPITTNGDGYILPRDAEMIINAKYYPTGTPGEWPVDPETGEKLPIEPQLNKNGSNMMPINVDSSYRDVSNLDRISRFVCGQRHCHMEMVFKQLIKQQSNERTTI